MRRLSNDPTIRLLEPYAKPANPFVAGFIGGEVAARAGVATVGARPEHLAVAESGAWTGADTMPYVDVPGIRTLTARVLGDGGAIAS